MSMEKIEHFLLKESLRIIGVELGYEVEVESLIDVYLVDVVWKKEGETVAFEIENTKEVTEERKEALSNLTTRFISVPISTIMDDAEKKDRDSFSFALTLFSKGLKIGEIARVTKQPYGNIFSWIKGGGKPRFLSKEEAKRIRERIS